MSSSLDLSRPLQNARLASDPTGLTAADAGLMWHNTTEDVGKYWDGAQKITLGSAPDLSNYYTKTQSDGRYLQSVPDSYATDVEVATAAAGVIAAHNALADPHTQYQKESEKNVANGYAGLNAQVRIDLQRMGSGAPDDGMYVDGGTGAWTTLPSGGEGGSGGHVIQNDASNLTQRDHLNFEGAGVTAIDDPANNATRVVIPGGGGGGGAASYASLVKFGAA